MTGDFMAVFIVSAHPQQNCQWTEQLTVLECQSMEGHISCPSSISQRKIILADSSREKKSTLTAEPELTSPEIHLDQPTKQGETSEDNREPE